MNRRISLDEKLAALQENDSHRPWHSLGDRRVCILCGEVIDGHPIEVWQDDERTYRSSCPTAGCAGTIRDWFYQGLTQGTGQETKSRGPILGFGYHSRTSGA